LTAQKYRLLRGPALSVVNFLFLAMVASGSLWISEIHSYLGLTFMKGQYIGLFMALSLAIVFLLTPARPGKSTGNVPWYDWILSLLGLFAGGFLAVFYSSLQYELALETPLRIFLGLITVVLVVEALRRLTGPFLVFLVGFFVLYARFADYFPSLLNARGTPWSEIFNYLYLDSNGIIGIPLWVASTIVLTFVLMGHCLAATGGARFFMDLSMAIMGRFRGGSAKMAVISSSLFGTISGSAVGNVVTTGIITIPMMKKTGFKPKVAAGIEAAASTGGQLMPPVMGAAAFLIAELLAVPYTQVVTAALIPAVLYYFTLFIQIDMEAAKSNITGVPRDELPKIMPVLKTGWPFIVPLLVLIYALFILHFQPAKAGLAAVAAVLALSFLNSKNRITLSKLHGIIQDTGRSILEIIIICSAAGIVIGVLNVSGLGFGLSLELVKAFGHNLFLLLLLSAVVCIILGMGMPTVAVYILLAILVAPALIEQGVVPIAAHLFIFYFGMMCMITPPVCLASYAAATIAGSNPIRTGWTAMRLAVVAFIVPFLFVIQPALLLIGRPEHLIPTILTAILGCYFLAAGLTRYLFSGLPRVAAVLAGLGGLLLLFPGGTDSNIGWMSDIVGLLIVGPILIWDWKRTYS